MFFLLIHFLKTLFRFARTLLWDFEDIRMCIGSNMPIFGDADHPCVSLRLQPYNKPISILTGLDYWLDNLMCQVPEVLMCYHDEGFVVKYEILNHDDLLYIIGKGQVKFSERVIHSLILKCIH
jgi:hypothetical protein